MKKVIIFLSIILLTIILTYSSCTRIDAGHEGILIKQYGSEKGIQDASLVTGRVWYNPINEYVEQYATFIQTVDYQPFLINAKGGGEFTVDPTLSFNIVAGNSPKIFLKYRQKLKEITNTTILNYVKDAFRIQMNKYTTDEILNNQEVFENAVQKTLSDVLNKEGFRLEQLTSGLKYPQSIVDAVNDKNKIIQETIGATNKLRKDSIQAQSLIITAKAEKLANDLKQSSLTPMLIQQQFIEKWNGSTPLYGNSPLLFQNIK